jgi:antitoxin (DNA-binding transcriptional repressor) of toxin-antitoxin stability system
MTQTVTVDEVGEQFDQLLAKLTSCEDEIIILRDGIPVARLTPVVARPKRRVPGCDAGNFVVPPAFFTPLPDEIVDEFYK